MAVLLRQFNITIFGFPILVSHFIQLLFSMCQRLGVVLLAYFVSPQVFPDLHRQGEYVHPGPFPSVVPQSS